MSVGIPGTGIGGLFYLASGLLIPVREILASARRRERAAKVGPLIVRQTFLVIGVLAGIWITGWMLGFLLSQPAGLPVAIDGSGSGAPRGNLWGTASVLAGVGTLLIVLATVEAARLLLRKKKRSVRRNSSRAEAAAGIADVA